ncbi:MAG: hypothetical protein E3K32_01365 [wastewater metagenome]|nr:hypothetical protein [Candidatus Loosdrechtia aerotolerans]
MCKLYDVKTVLLIIIALLLIIVIFKHTPNYVIAQGDGSARRVFGVVGVPIVNRQPFYLVDTEEQTIMVYEYFPGGGLGLAAVRSYKYDKGLQQYGKLYGLSVEDVKKTLLKEQTKYDR